MTTVHFHISIMIFTECRFIEQEKINELLISNLKNIYLIIIHNRRCIKRSPLGKERVVF